MICFVEKQIFELPDGSSESSFILHVPYRSKTVFISNQYIRNSLVICKEQVFAKNWDEETIESARTLLSTTYGARKRGISFVMLKPGKKYTPSMIEKRLNKITSPITKSSPE